MLLEISRRRYVLLSLFCVTSSRITLISAKSSLMPVTPQLSAGFASGTIGRKQRRRPSDEPSNAYAAARIEEIRVRSELYKLRLRRAKGELLDGKLLIAELTAAFGAIKDVILNSSQLTHNEKIDLLRNLAEIPTVLVPAASESPASTKST